MPKRPFHSGSQYEYWSSVNCEQCALGAKDHKINCPIEEALLVAFFDDGAVSDEIYQRMGAKEGGPHSWPCPEKQ